MTPATTHNSMPVHSDVIARADCDPIAHFGPPEDWANVGRFRFVPLSYLSACDLKTDSGLAHLLFLRSLVSEEAED